MPTERPEAAILAAILQYLGTRGIYAWRVNTGSMVKTNRAGKSRLVRFGKRGTPDIAGIVKAQNGRALFIEVKRPGEHPTTEQSLRLNILRSEHAIAFWATSVDDVAKELAAVNL